MLHARTFRWLANAAAFLYAGRLIAEWLHPPTAAVLLIIVAALAAATASTVWWKRSLPWAALLLWLYVLYPQADVRAALLVGLAALLAGLLLRSSFAAWRWPALVLFALGLALYLPGLVPGVQPADSGELQLVAAELGVAHPPGFPLYTMIAHLFTRLPLGDEAALRVTVFSAVTSAATLALVYLAARRVTGQVVPALTAGLALASATTFWAQATTANVRSLAAFFTALLFYLVLRWKEAPESGWRLAAVALALSLGVGHHASLVFSAAVVLVYIIYVEPSLVRQPRRWLLPGGAAVLGLIPLLYLPLRAASGAHGTDPALATLTGFLEHVLATGFRGDFFAFSTPAALAARLAVMGNVLLFQFEPLLLGGMALGLVVLALTRRWRLLLLLGGSFAAHTLVTAMYRAPQTVEYMLPAYVAAALLLAAGAAAPWRRRLAAHGRALLQAALLVTTVVQAADHTGSYRTLHDNADTQPAMTALLAAAPEDSLLLAGWHWATPLWYLQQVEGQRPDVQVEYVFPTDEEYAATWAQRIAAGQAAGRPVIATHYDEAAYAALPAPLPLGEAFLFPVEPLATLPDGYTEVELMLGETIVVSGYRLEGDEVSADDETVLTLAWRPLQAELPPLSLFAHLLGPEGELRAQVDVPARAQPEGLALTRLPLVPRPGTTPGEYAVLFGAYTADGTPLPGTEGEARLALETVTVTARPLPPFTQQPVSRVLAGEERTLVGYDWDHTLAAPRLYLHWRTAHGYVTEVRDAGNASLPPWRGPWGIVRDDPVPARPGQHYVPLGQGLVWLGEQALDGIEAAQPGERLALPQRLAASQPVAHDLVVSVRLIGYERDGFHWAWWDLDDGVPALGAIPTLKWIAGSEVRDPHWAEVAAAATSGQKLGGLVRLYDAFTGQAVPVLDERLAAGLPAIPLGEAVVRP